MVFGVNGSAPGADEEVLSFQVFQVIPDGHLADIKFFTESCYQYFASFLYPFEDLFSPGNGKSFFSFRHIMIDSYKSRGKRNQFMERKQNKRLRRIYKDFE